MFFSHNKSAGTMFWLVFSAKRTEPLYALSELAHFYTLLWAASDAASLIAKDLPVAMYV